MGYIRQWEPFRSWLEKNKNRLQSLVGFHLQDSRLMPTPCRAAKLNVITFVAFICSHDAMAALQVSHLDVCGKKQHLSTNRPFGLDPPCTSMYWEPTTMFQTLHGQQSPWQWDGKLLLDIGNKADPMPLLLTPEHGKTAPKDYLG